MHSTGVDQCLTVTIVFDSNDSVCVRSVCVRPVCVRLVCVQFVCVSRIRQIVVDSLVDSRKAWRGVGVTWTMRLVHVVGGVCHVVAVWSRDWSVWRVIFFQSRFRNRRLVTSTFSTAMLEIN